MRIDYIPRQDQEFHAWQVNFLTYLTANAVALGMSVNDITDLTNSQTDWTKAIEAHVELHAQAKAAFAEKVDARAAYSALIRNAVQRVQVIGKTTDADRKSLGITVRDSIRSPAPPPETRPLIRVSMGERLRHRVRILNEGEAIRGAKPRRTVGAELFVALTDARTAAPADPAAYRYLSLVTASSARVEFTAPDAGRTAHYMAHWVSTRGAKGPWSETASATVGG